MECLDRACDYLPNVCQRDETQQTSSQNSFMTELLSVKLNNIEVNITIRTQ